MLIFFVGVLAGVVTGGMLCIRYLRREISDDIGPKLKRVQSQLDTLESQLNLAIMTWYAEAANRTSGQLPG